MAFDANFQSTIVVADRNLWPEMPEGKHSASRKHVNRRGSLCTVVFLDHPKDSACELRHKVFLSGGDGRLAVGIEEAHCESRQGGRNHADHPRKAG